MNSPSLSIADNSPLLSLDSIAGVGDRFSTKEQAEVESVIIKPTQALLHKILQAESVKAVIGDWSTNVWGPAIDVKENKKDWPNSSFPIAKKGEFQASNSMYITEQNGLYVVSIAGTDPASRFDWSTEDFDVFQRVTWQYAVPGYPVPSNAQISQGISDGLEALINMKATVNQSGALVSAVDFLRDAGARNIVVSGHSLGGTLTPVFALYLKSQLPDAQVHAAPFAGATPGDEGFATYYKTVGMDETTVRFVNSNDIVPHAFNVTQLNELYTLYDVPPAKIKLSQNEGVGTKLAEIIALLTGPPPANYQHVGGQVYGFAGKIVAPPEVPGVPPFLIEACYQHLNAYVIEFALEDFINAVAGVLDQQSYFNCPLFP